MAPKIFLYITSAGTYIQILRACTYIRNLLCASQLCNSKLRHTAGENNIDMYRFIETPQIIYDADRKH